MAGEALRSLYAEVGWKIDEAPLQKLDKLLDQIKASMLGGAVEKFESDLEGATDDAKRLGQSISEAGSQTKKFGDAVETTGSKAKKAFDRPRDAMGRFVKVTNEAADETRKLSDEVQGAGNEAGRSQNKFRRLGNAIADAARDNIRHWGALGREINKTIRLGERMDRLGRGITDRFWGMGRSILRAPFTLPGMLIGGAATYGAVRYGFMNPLRMASEFEQAEIAFTTMLGSAERARDFIAEMNRFAIETPFELAGVQDAAKRMLAFGFKQEQIIPYLTAIGNAAAGLGGGTDLIDRISLAIGQMQAKAKVSAEEMLQLTEAGIPAWEILATKMNKSTREVMDLSSKGLIPADKAIAMLIEGMNERFPDMLQKQADSFDGLKSQISETFNLQFIKRWGDGLLQALKPRFASINQWIDNNQDRIQRWGSALEKTAFEGFDYLLRQGERAFEYIRTNYLENKEFQQLPFNKKIEYVFSDIEQKFKAWYNGGGKASIEEGARRFVDFTIGVLEASVPQMADVGIKLGKSIGSGLVKGLGEAAKDHPILAGLVTAAATPGGPAVKAAAGATATISSGILGAAEKSIEKQEQARQERMNRVTNFYDRLESKPSDQPLFTGGTISAAPKQSWWDRTLDWTKQKVLSGIPGHADGLPYVPKDDYIARLHEGERVLTKQENRRYTQGQTRQSAAMMPNVTINVNVSAAAAASGVSTVREAAKQGAREGLEEFWRSMRMKYPAIREV
jgi:tape measure domain-containing protein